VAVDTNGNVYVVGYGTNIASSSSGNDWWIKKFSSSGVEDTSNWDKRIDGNSGEDFAYSVAVGSEGSAYVGGYGSNLVSSTSGSDWWVKKFIDERP
jgi:hypothetical protein